MNGVKKIAGALALAGLAGCFTVSETEYPSAGMAAVPREAANRSIAVRGFEASVTDYMMVEGWSTVYVAGGCGRRWCSPGGYEVVRTTTAVPQVRATGAYLRQVKDRLESVGIVTMANTPDYVVEGSFAGPFAGDNAQALRFLYNLCTLFTCDKAPYAWKGTLKIYDNRTGRLALRREYEQAHDVRVFSPIPIFGISHCERTGRSYAQAWCLSALTDRMAADVAAFLAAPEASAK